MNRRNWLIAQNNPRDSIHGVNDKFATKRRLAAHGVPVPDTLALLDDREALGRLAWDELPDAWAVKPNHGRRGEGIVLAVERRDDGWLRASGCAITIAGLRAHASHILDGEFSLDGAHSDAVIIEPLIRAHSAVARLVPYGLPDIRVICFGPVPLMAMVRLPTLRSDGKANLHQGAIGAAVDFGTGRIFRAVLDGLAIETHPDTGAQLLGFGLPHWRETVVAASRCGAALGLGYVGVDLVLDDTDGVMVLECNAHPGLEIQNINARGLRTRVEHAQRFLRSPDRKAPRVGLLSANPTRPGAAEAIRQIGEPSAPFQLKRA
ncbi:hypothetical protein HME9302_01338 [Alteripontixanthobacter maritimus]|uniref:ATP-grasp domain-containing protein n=1 Tax=Alteripontixanthobacter maritimus TaxID=2161824 RepID=A0A369QB49_9SPHN|nr:sugar-transfer associated ATP-grasp domain-containing protein [Alteripontixanthobacter maritimus]RDC60139.1 hypothetical protein HME9302_01338 [Alteripontixanthobacter maritimus]